jgi:hypothetical protein
MSSINVRQIVEKYLKDNGYDGLFSEYECACSFDDFMPCSGTNDMLHECEAGHKFPCDCGEHDYHIGIK